MRLRPVRPSTSLRSRLSWSASAVVAGWVVLLAVGANILLSSALDRQADGVLQARAEATATTVQTAADGTVTVLNARDDRSLDVGTWIFQAGGGLVESPAGSPASVDAAAAALATDGVSTRDLDGDDPLRLLALPVTDNDRVLAVVVVSTSLSPYAQLQRLALLGSAAVAALLILVVHLVLRANVGRALRPVQQMTAQAGRWSADDVSRRFGASPRPTELAELAGTLDHLLDRLSAVLRHEQRFSEELSHELRTPLARIQTGVDLLAVRPRSRDEQQRANAVIDDAAGTMRDILDTLMSAARNGQAIAPGRADLEPVLHRLAAEATLPARVRIDVQVGKELLVGVDAAVITRVLSPVLDNAARYADARVRISAEPEGSHLAVIVSDDGPGMSPQTAQRAFEPGYQADPGDRHVGAGLGLALAHRLVTAAGGDIEAVPSTAGGRVVIRLPAG